MADTIKFGHGSFLVDAESGGAVRVMASDEVLAINFVTNSPVELLKLTNALLRAYAQVVDRGPAWQLTRS